MIDITKEEFWNSNYEEVEETIRKERTLNKIIKKHKLITIALVSLGILIMANTILIYNFFKILKTM